MVLTSIVFSIRLSGDCRNFLPVTIPALFTKIVTSPTSALTYNTIQLIWLNPFRNHNRSTYGFNP